MKTLIPILIVSSIMPIKGKSVEHAEKPKAKVARITFWSHDEPNYKFGKSVASDSKRKAKEGRTIAIDNKKIRYGTRVRIPNLNGIVGDGIFVAEDTGTAVKQMRAIPIKMRKNVEFVVDVYVDSSEKMIELSNQMPHYMMVYF